MQREQKYSHRQERTLSVSNGLIIILDNSPDSARYLYTGVVTSGIPSPTLSRNIAMAYVQTGFHKKGTEVEVEVRNKLRNAVLTPMPFIKPKYWRG